MPAKSQCFLLWSTEGAQQVRTASRLSHRAGSERSTLGRAPCSESPSHPSPPPTLQDALAGSEQCIVGLVVWRGLAGGRGHSTIFHRRLVGLAPWPNGAAASGPLGAGPGWCRSRAGLGALYPLESLLRPRPGAALGPGRGLVGSGHCPPPSVGRVGGECEPPRAGRPTRAVSAEGRDRHRARKPRGRGRSQPCTSAVSAVAPPPGCRVESPQARCG